MLDNDKKRESEKKSNTTSKNDLEVKLPPEILNISQKVSIEEMERYFPHLHTEINEDKMTLGIDNVEEGFAQSNEEKDFFTPDDPYSDFEPSVIDFIRRAKTEAEALEVIEFLQKKGTITDEEALRLMGQIKENGVRSFGPIRTPGHYFRKAAEIKNRRLIQKRYSTPKKE